MAYVETLLNLPLPAVVLGVFVVLAIASEAGFYAGAAMSRRFRTTAGVDNDVDTNAATITNSSLALLALFLGFAFSSALSHFEKNRDAVTGEAVAITEVLNLARVQPSPYAEQLVSRLEKYVDHRLRVAELPNEPKAIRELQLTSTALQKELWTIVESQAKVNPNAPLLVGLVDALNGLVAAEKNRTESLINGVPDGIFVPVALFLMFNGVLLGVSLGEGKRRHVILSWGLYFLVALAVGIIADLDRPLQGFINVDQAAMMVVKQSF